MESFLRNIGLASSQHVILHSSFKKIKEAFPEIEIADFISILKTIITKEGSIIIPAFTYCFKKSEGETEIFEREISKSKVGAVSEVFRKDPETVRTSSPTHSFSLWGKVKEEISFANSPKSPLGKNSVLDWLAAVKNSYVLMLGTDFNSFTFGHFLEVKAKVPWYNYSPWDYLNVLPAGISTNGEQELIELPGCSKSFVNFENYLISNNLISKHEYDGLNSYFISIELLLEKGIPYFRNHYKNLLCKEGTCRACDSRRTKFHKEL